MTSPLDKVPASPIIEVMGWKRDLPDDIIDLCQAAPDYPPADELQTYLQQCMQTPETVFSYTPVFGLPDARTAAADDISRAYGAQVGADHIALTAGCNQAFCAVASALCARGDEVILPLPYYFNHAMWLDAIGARGVLLPYAPRESDADFVARMEALITPATRAMVVVTPDNPTGRTRTPESLSALFDLAARHDIKLILDETYRVFRAADAPPHDLFQRRDWSRHFVHLYSYSKALGLSGMRIGLFAGALDILDACAKWLDCAAICPPAPAQLAAAFGARELGAWTAERRKEKLALQARFAEMMKDTPGGFESVSAGAFFAWVRHPHEGQSAVDVARRLAFEHRVLCLPGTAFGPGCDSYLRWSVANATQARLSEAVDALRADAPRA